MGSEMCIRDRFMRAQPCRWGKHLCYVRKGQRQRGCRAACVMEAGPFWGVRKGEMLPVFQIRRKQCCGGDRAWRCARHAPSPSGKVFGVQRWEAFALGAGYSKG